MPDANARKGDYRIFVGIFPEGDLANEIHALREHHDPQTALKTRPHVTLCGLFWRHGAAVAESEAETITNLQAALRVVPAFELRLGGIDTFGKDVAYIAAEATDGMLAARAVCREVLGADRDGFVPHMTIAMRLPKERLLACAGELRTLKWHTDRYVLPVPYLSLMQRSREEPAWRAIAKMPLAATS
ncbi:MAG: 2'-5' RNA ligase family protein [Planctomycetota bacterium]